MLRNYLKIAWRNLRKNKAYSAINIAGLAIGLAACIIIALFVRYEKSYDAIHTKNIYRLNEVQNFEGMVAPQKVALTMAPMGPALQAEMPEVISYTRINSARKVDFSYREKKVFIDRTFLADSTFFRLFNYPLLKGDRTTLLSQPRNVVLSKTMAEKFFGEEDPIGKAIVHYDPRDTLSLLVTGVMEDIPENSHLQFDAVVSFSTMANPDRMNNWGGNWLNTYLELAPNADVAALEKKFPAFLKKHMNNDNWKNYVLFLQPLADVHAGSSDITHDYNNFRKFDRKHTNIFSIIAFIVLLIACINFVNLSTARSAERAREVGIRKSVGAYRMQLIFQFIGESLLMVFIALVLAIALVELALPYVRNLSQRDLTLPLFSDGSLLLSIACSALVIGILAGVYPAFYLSAFNPVTVLKGLDKSGRNKSVFRSVLVVGQFAGATFLIIATILAVKQLRFMEQRDPGFDREQMVTIRMHNLRMENYPALKQQLLSNTLIKGVTACQQGLGNNLHQSGIDFRGKNVPLRTLTSSRTIVDPDYLKVYNIPLVAGRNFSDNPSENGRTMIINEALARELLRETPKATYEDLIGTQLGYTGMDSLPTIIGIAKDFNFNTLHHKIETLFLFNQSNWGYGELSVKIDGTRAKEAITFIESVYNQYARGYPMDYIFLDDHFAELYRADAQVSEIIGILAALAIMISCLGLFGLASFAAEKRTREVGIRKVLGASAKKIVMLLSVSFLKLVIIANLIAWPLAWWLLNNWLQDFAYRIEVGWWVFALTGLLSLLIAMLTVSYQAMKAALMNPVKSLRSE